MDSMCTYGGLIYAFKDDLIRLWRPTNAINGGVICVGNVLGNGTKAQRSRNSGVVVHVWALKLKGSGKLIT